MKPKRKTLKMPGWALFNFVSDENISTTKYERPYLQSHIVYRTSYEEWREKLATLEILLVDIIYTSVRHRWWNYQIENYFAKSQRMRDIMNSNAIFCVGKQRFKRQREKRYGETREEEQKMFRILNSMHEKELSVENIGGYLALSLMGLCQ